MVRESSEADSYLHSSDGADNGARVTFEGVVKMAADRRAAADHALKRTTIENATTLNARARGKVRRSRRNSKGC
jgi:hypothetical protein